MFSFVKKFVNDKKNPKPRWQQAGDPFERTVEQVRSEVTKVVVDAVSINGFLGNISNMDDKQMAEVKKNDEKEKETEMQKIRSQIQRRDVGGEMVQITREQEKQKEEEERMAFQRKRQLDMERQERQKMQEIPGNSKKPGKEAQKRQFAKGPKKASTSAPSQEQLTQTGEFTQKME